MVGIKTTIGSKGQVVIPTQIREEIGLYPGERVEFDQEEDKIIIKKSKSDSIKMYSNIKNMMEKQGKKFTIEDYKKIKWDELYESEIEERTGTK